MKKSLILVVFICILLSSCNFSESKINKLEKAVTNWNYKEAKEILKELDEVPDKLTVEQGIRIGDIIINACEAGGVALYLEEERDFDEWEEFLDYIDECDNIVLSSHQITKMEEIAHAGEEYWEKIIEEKKDSKEEMNSKKEKVDVDAVLDQLESKIKKLQKLDKKRDDDKYDAIEDEIYDLMDTLDDCDMTSVQEKRYDRLDDEFDRLDDGLDDEDDEW